jgi:hypothetical protein
MSEQTEVPTEQEALQLYRALAWFGDVITGYRLKYKRKRRGFYTRFQAAAALAASGAVAPSNLDGHYIVKSSNKRLPKKAYDTLVRGEAIVVVQSKNKKRGKKIQYLIRTPSETICDCEDSIISPLNPLGICIHQIAAAMRWAVEQA